MIGVESDSGVRGGVGAVHHMAPDNTPVYVNEKTLVDMFTEVIAATEDDVQTDYGGKQSETAQQKSIDSDAKRRKLLSMLQEVDGELDFMLQVVNLTLESRYLSLESFPRSQTDPQLLKKNALVNFGQKIKALSTAGSVLREAGHAAQGTMAAQLRYLSDLSALRKFWKLFLTVEATGVVLTHVEYGLNTVGADCGQSFDLVDYSSTGHTQIVALTGPAFGPHIRLCVEEIPSPCSSQDCGLQTTSSTVEQSLETSIGFSENHEMLVAWQQSVFARQTYQELFRDAVKGFAPTTHVDEHGTIICDVAGYPQLNVSLQPEQLLNQPPRRRKILEIAARELLMQQFSTWKHKNRKPSALWVPPKPLRPQDSPNKKCILSTVMEIHAHQSACRQAISIFDRIAAQYRGFSFHINTLPVLQPSLVTIFQLQFLSQELWSYLQGTEFVLNPSTEGPYFTAQEVVQHFFSKICSTNSHLAPLLLSLNF
ncbi:hypothetical protein Pelo_1728 [Pelomyxa schiedti]|nr:hypothetical protein Pelo_1728 [Pelomyxa schiedti]